jgi:superfamily II DNA or RNA helicase
MDWSDADVGRAVDKPELVGDIVSHWLRLANGTPTVCFASNIAHSKHIVEQFLVAGVRAEHIDCYTPEEERQAILRRIETGETTLISNVGILCEGWDFPACKTLILARPTKSLVRYLQMAGRVLRPHEHKERALILDHSGTVTRLGFPTEEFPLELDDGKPKEAGIRERKEKLPRPCPRCAFMKVAPKCPICNFVATMPSDVTVQDGELVKLAKKATMPDKQDFYSQLLAIALSRGYAKGWVSHKFREKFGVWPKGLKHEAAEPTPEVKNFLKHLQIRQVKAKEAQRAAA